MSATHIMLDIETMGTKPGCAICSIGAVEFVPETGELRSDFESNITLDSCAKAGLTCDPTTVAIQALNDDPAPLADVLAVFTRWLLSFGPAGKLHLWANSPSFDCAILSAAYDAVGMETPWKYWQERDYRTAKSLISQFDLPDAPPFNGVRHTALADARHQARIVYHLFACQLAATGTAQSSMDLRE